MKIITLWQPWASFIAWGWKTIETRTHDRFKSLVGERIGIHAGNNWDKNWRELAAPYLIQMQIDEVGLLKSAFDLGYCKGEIICTAKVEKAHWLLHEWRFDSQALCECDNDLFGLFLTDIMQIEPIPAKGKQGIWIYG